MEGKKKKNKKKKGNQAKQNDSTSTMEDVNQTKQNDSVSNAVVIDDHDHASVSEMNQCTEAPSDAISQSCGVSVSDAEQEGIKNLEENCEVLHEEVNMVEVEKDMLSQKEGNLEERTKYLQDQVGSCIQREEELQEKINKLEVEKNAWSQKEGFLEERIKYLQEEVSSCIQREVSLEDKLSDLQSKNASLTLREDGLEERVERVEDLNQSFTLEKSSIKKMVSNLGDANDGLQMQVMELKESRDNLEKENKHLTERISTLESRIQHLEMVSSSYDSSKIHGEKERHQKEAEVSMEQDVPNEESAPKVSEIHVEPDNGQDIATAASDDILKSDECILESNGNIQTMGDALESFRTDGGESEQIRLLGFDDSGKSEDVVSVPLDDNAHWLKPTGEEMDSEQTIPISDAPLIGAPFRLISFVTRYVSGADLVDQPKSRR